MYTCVALFLHGSRTRSFDSPHAGCHYRQHHINITRWLTSHGPSLLCRVNTTQCLCRCFIGLCHCILTAITDTVVSMRQSYLFLPRNGGDCFQEASVAGQKVILRNLTALFTKCVMLIGQNVDNVFVKIYTDFGHQIAQIWVWETSGKTVLEPRHNDRCQISFQWMLLLTVLVSRTFCFHLLCLF